MNIAIPIHRATRKAAERLCQSIADLGGVSSHNCYLCADENGIADNCLAILEGVFNETVVRVVCARSPEWPARENEVFQATSREFQYIHKTPWLRVETDSVPLREAWLDEIEVEWSKRGRWQILSGLTENPARFCGCAVFPPNLIDLSLGTFQTLGKPWFQSGNDQLRAFTASTPLMDEEPTDRTALALRQKHPGEGKIDRHCFIQLGRFGDILNILPLMLHVNKTEGKPVLMVHKDFAEVAEGLDYCDVDVWSGPSWTDVSAAAEEARDKYSKVSIPQIHGDRWQTRRESESFCIESWRQAGYPNEFGRHGLYLNEPEKPIHPLPPNDILVSAAGHSSPFPLVDDLWSLVHSTGLSSFDISRHKLPKIKDLLSHYERSSILITTDTATLHLAQASDIPVIALIADAPTRWHGSAPKGNCVLSVRYSDFRRRSPEIIDAIRHNRRGVEHPAKLHIFQEYSGEGDTRRRNDLARETWLRECVSGWHPVGVGGISRTARTIGDPRDMFFIKDVIDAGVSGFGDATIAMFTNTDICLRYGLTHEINRLTGEAYYSHRRDFPRIDRPLTINEIETGKWYPGSDLFVFTVGWWKRHRDEMPDMILGAEGWDKILRAIVKLSGGGEIQNCCYHERHASTWFQAGNRENDPSNRYCRILAREWLTAHSLPWEEMARFADTDGSPGDFIRRHPNLPVTRKKHVRMKAKPRRKQAA